jgi:MrfA Zn-binding domain
MARTKLDPEILAHREWIGFVRSVRRGSLMKAHGQVRRGQVITTYGPGALIDLPRHSAIVGGLDTWPNISDLEEILEPRLTRKLQFMTSVAVPPLYAPPPDSNDPRETAKGIGVWRFPEWFVVQEASSSDERERSRRLVHRMALDNKGQFDRRPVVATRFVRACPRGHVDDLDWRRFVHTAEDTCRRQLWLDERGTSGDLADLVVRCECGKSRSLYEATQLEMNPLGTCRGARPWLGRNTEENCKLPSRLLIRTASNAYFPQVVSVLSLPDRGSAVETAVRELWDYLQIVDGAADLVFLKKKPKIAERLAQFSDDEVLAAIRDTKGGKADEKPVKQVELLALVAAPEGFGDDVPVDPNFHARRLPDRAWRRSKRSDGIQAVIQLHRLREVLALVGFTRFEAVTPDINGEYDTDVERAEIALDPAWFPAVENRGEGLFVQLRATAVMSWLVRPAVKQRLDALASGYRHWAKDRKSLRPFPGGPYVLLHTLSHLLIQSLAMRCGYPASSIRERIYADNETQQFGILLYTGSPDAEGTLGGLVQQARHIEDHLAQALRMSALCSSDPVCAQHAPGESLEGRWLHGAACHGCALGG